MSSKASIRWVLKGPNGYVIYNEGLDITPDLLKALLFYGKEEAEEFSRGWAAKESYEAIRVSHMVTIDLVPEFEKPEGDGNTVKGDPYPKHWDML